MAKIVKIQSNQTANIGKSGDFIKRIIIIPLDKTTGDVTIKIGSITYKFYQGGLKIDPYPINMQLDVQAIENEFQVAVGANLEVNVIGDW